MAVIHLATQVTPAGERLVAIKQIERPEEVGRAAHARLVTEARLVFQLTHANICQVLDLGENEQGTFIVIEYVHGCDLAALMSAAEGGVLDVPVCLYVAREVARALDYAHRRTDASGRSLGLVHGDVTPRNVLLSIEGEVKLADFGIARALNVLAPGSGMIGGTPGFIAPEVVDGTIDLRSDVYSLGMTMARALGGAPVGDEGPAARALARADLGGVREIIVRSTAREPSARFASAGEMERALALELSRRYPGFTPSILARVVSRQIAERGVRPPEVLPSTATTFAMHTLIAPPAAPEPPPFIGRTATVVPARRHGAVRRRRRLLALASAGMAAAVGLAIALALWPEPAPPAPDAGVVAVAPVAPIDAGAAPAAPDAAPPAPDRPSSPRPRAARKSARPPDREPGFVSVNATPWGAVYIDGKRVADETPLYRHPLPAGRHEVRVYYSEDKVYSKRRIVELEPGQHRSIGFER
jgi:hypothetical protein